MIDVERLKERLKAVQKTPNAVSEAAGLGRTYVRDILRGRIKDPSAWRLSQLADVLGCSPGYLIAKEDSEWPIGLPDADDRTEIAHEFVMKRILGAQRTNSPTNKLMFDLLDTVDERTLIAMVYGWIGSNIFRILEMKFGLAKSELGILAGDELNFTQADYMRRIIVAKLLGLIEDNTYRQAIIISQIHEYNESTVLEKELFTEKSIPIFNSLLKSAGIAPQSTRETVRLVIMAIFAKFLEAELLAGSPGKVVPAGKK